MASSRFRIPALSEQHVLDNVQLHLLTPADTMLREQFRELMEQHHYLKSDILVGEQLRYVAEVDGRSSRFAELERCRQPPQGSRAMARLEHFPTPTPPRARRQ